MSKNGKCSTRDFATLSRVELVGMAKERGVVGVASMNKTALIASIVATPPQSTTGERVAARKMAGGRVAPKPKPETTLNSLDLAAGEQVKLKAWEKAGRKGPRPTTPNYDAILAANTAEPGPRRGTSSGQPRAKRVVRYLRDGKPLSDSHNSLSTLAYHFTAGVGGKDVQRIPTADLRALLTKLGVENPDQPGWSVTLPNGRVFAAVSLDEAVEAEAKPKPGRNEIASAAFRGTAKKAAPAKPTAAKPAAAKPTAKRVVRTKAKPDGTPIPKGAPRKRK